MKQFETGLRVGVVCHGGKRRENVVWERGERVVYLCSERQFAALRAGLPAPPPIGFSIEDVEDGEHEQARSATSA